MTKLVIAEAAQKDIRDGRDWYDNEEPGLGATFVRELSATMDRVRAMPGQFPEIRSGVRRALLHRFPFAAYFLEGTAAVIVFAVLHQHRNPFEWKRRAKQPIKDR